MKSFFHKMIVLFVIFNLSLTQSWTVQAQGTIPETPTPTQTPSETQIPVTEEITETSTPFPNASETPIPASGTPAQEITATPDATATSSEIPPSEEASPQYSLSLSSNPAFLTSGGIVNLNWVIEGDLSADAQLMLQISLPIGFEVVKKTDAKLLDPVTGLYSIPVTTSQGGLLIQTNKVINEDSFFSARLVRDGESLAEASFILPLHERFEIKADGGKAQAFNGRVKVIIPSGALSEDIVLTAGFPMAKHLPENGFSENVFELTAQSKDKAKEETEIKQFNAPLTIEVDYNGLKLTKAQEDQLYLYWYNEETGDWHALESYRDKKTKTLRAYSDHFTVFDIGVNDWRATRLPTIESFQVAQFTGAATYTLPIEVPAGPGGLQPNITLSYNSQVVDQATTKSQAAWVGMGWSLDGGGSITENGDGSGYMLVVNGVSTQLIQEETGGRYHAMEENFWKIERLSTEDAWRIYDTEGNIYLFNERAKYAYFEGVYKQKTYAWYLTSVTNASGKSLVYDYVFQYNNNIGNVRTDTAAYLNSITYPGDQVRVRFVRKDRTDYTLAYDDDAAVHLYEKYSLNNILVEQKNESGIFEKVRKYEFTYIGDPEGGDTNDNIWKNITYSAGGNVLTLRSVQELVSTDGTMWDSSLPPTTFIYDGLHLTSATNGYGGAVQFVYDPDTAIDIDTDPEPWYGTNVPNEYIRSNSSCLSWIKYDNATTACNTSTNELTVTNGGVGKSFLSDASSSILRPGGVYQVTFTGAKTSGSNIKVGMLYRSSTNYKQVGQNNTFTYIVYPLNKAASLTARVYFEAAGTGTFTTVQVKLMPSFYRVTQKTVLDGNNHSYVTSYSYQSPKFVLPEYEFRGHRIVTETAPDGTVTKTTFYQDDPRKGKVEKIAVFGSSGSAIQSETINSYGVTSLPEYPTSTKYAHAWVHLDSQENRIYDSNGVLAGGTRTVYTYDSSYGNLIRKDEYGGPVAMSILYRVTETTYNPKHTSTTYIVSAPEMQQVKDVGGNVLAETRYFYNYSNCFACAPTANLLTMTRSWVDGTRYAQKNYTYDEWGNQTSVTAYSEYSASGSYPPSGAQTTSTEYDGTYHTYPVKITNALLQYAEYDYDYRLGVATSMIDLNQNPVLAEYDAFGRMTKLIRSGDDANSPTLSMSYQDSFPFITSITQKIDETLSFTIIRKYDGMGREIETNVGGVVTTTVYESATVTKQSLPNEPTVFTTTIYNPATQTTTVYAPDGTSTSTKVNGLTTTTSQYNSSGVIFNNHTTTTTTDAWGQVTKVTPPTGPEVGYSYDPLNNLIDIRRGPSSPNQAGPSTHIEYDSAGHKTSMSDPDMGYWQYGYDALGNLTSQTDARNCTLTMSYDVLNRLVDKNSNGDPDCGKQVHMSYAYDDQLVDNSIGHRTKAENHLDNIVSSWKYDERGRVISETVMDYPTKYGYNSADLMTLMEYPDGEKVTFEPNDRMLIEELSGKQNDVTTTYASSMLYDSAGRLTSRLLGNGLTQNFTYNPWTTQGGRLQNLLTGTLQDLNYTYDASGNVTQIRDDAANETHNYGYDSLDRLTSWTLNNVQQEVYTYDPNTGNLLTKGTPTQSGGQTFGATSYTTYDPSHIHAVQTLSNGNSYNYDANGNQITRTVNGESFTLIYDAENHLIEVKKNSVSIATFAYDGDGRRVKSVMGSETALFIGSHYEVTNPGSGQTITKYYFAGATRIAMRRYTIPQSMSVEYFLSDHLGSTSITTDNAATKVSEMRYKPWGEVRYSWKASQSTTPAYSLADYTFTGQYSYMDDPSTAGVTEGFGLMFYNARWYDPTLGRFAQADSIIPDGVQGLDRYAYVNNNPLRYTDPTGHDSICTGTGVKKICTITEMDMVYFVDSLEAVSESNRGGNPTYMRILGKVLNEKLPSWMQIPFAENPDSTKLDSIVKIIKTPSQNHNTAKEIVITYDTRTNSLIYGNKTVKFSEENTSAGYDSVSQGLDTLFGVTNDGTTDNVEPTKILFPIDNDNFTPTIPYTPGGGRGNRHLME